MTTKESVHYQIKVILKHVKPAIWRRVVVPGSLTLWQLHTVLQVVMEWQEMHLHMFEIDNTEYGDPANEASGLRKMRDEHSFRIDRVIPRKVGFRFNYTYDFGDTWEHALLVEKILPADGLSLPLCLAGSRAGALEDSGGPFGYMNFVESLQDPDHPRHIESLEWAGDTFDPEAFDIDDINERLDLLAENDYQMEALFDLDSEDEDTADSRQGETFASWVFTLPDELKQACEDLALRKDVLAFLTYLGDYRVKGTAGTGNLPLKAVREVTARFVDPPQLDFEFGNLRSEDEVPELVFVHSLSVAAGLLTGGQAKRWELTEDAPLFFQLPPAAQVLQLFVTWALNMHWALNNYFAVLDDNISTQARIAVIQHLAKQPAGEWLPFEPFALEVSKKADWQWPDAYDPKHNQEMLILGVFALMIDPMLTFGVVETRKLPGQEQSYDHKHTEIRFTPLGKSLLMVTNDLIPV